MGRISNLVTAVREVLDTRDLSTGLLKRAAFEQAVDAWVGGGDATRPATSLLMVQVGIRGAPLAEQPDRELLLDLARSVQTLLRATDICGHVDADTLGVLLPSTPVAQGTRAAERILGEFRSSKRAEKGNLAATIGVSGAGNLEPWLAALQALRDARLSGGDCVVVAPSRYSNEDDRESPALTIADDASGDAEPQSSSSPSEAA